MDGWWWKILSKWMIWESPHFRKPMETRKWQFHPRVVWRVQLPPPTRFLAGLKYDLEAIEIIKVCLRYKDGILYFLRLNGSHPKLHHCRPQRVGRFKTCFEEQGPTHEKALRTPNSTRFDKKCKMRPPPTKGNKKRDKLGDKLRDKGGNASERQTHHPTQKA